LGGEGAGGIIPIPIIPFPMEKNKYRRSHYFSLLVFFLFV
jgi:hypothetical protein